MKKYLKQLVNGLGYSICKLDSRVEIDCAWGPNILVYALNDLASRTQKKLKIIQIGANDGDNQDPLQPFLAKGKCEALLIEPMEHPFKALTERYAGSSEIRTLQAAISDRPGTIEIHYIVDASGKPDLTLYSSSDHAKVERILSSRRLNNPHYKDHSVQSRYIHARMLGDVAREFNLESLDAVVIDVEGFDHRIVRNFLNDGIEPKIIRFEYCNMSRRDFNALRDLLKAKNYEIARVGIDIYCQKAGLLR